MGKFIGLSLSVRSPKNYYNQKKVLRRRSTAKKFPKNNSTTDQINLTDQNTHPKYTKSPVQLHAARPRTYLHKHLCVFF